MKHFVRLFAFLFTLAAIGVVVAAMGVTAAAETTIVQSGTCGTNLTYTLDSDGTLQIDGTGAMTNWIWGEIYAPWYSQRSQIKTVVIGNSVTSIGWGAFRDCSSLTSVTIGNSVTSIGDHAFVYCSALTSVTIPDSVTGIGEAAFYYCASLTSVTIPDSVTSIGWDAFEYCYSLTSVTLGSHVTTIDDCAFEYCYKLVEVINRSRLSISAGSSNYGYVAYYAKEVHTGSSKIVNQDGYLFYPYNGTVYLLGYVGSDTALSLPDNFQGGSYEIYKYAFRGCSSLTSVTIPESITYIDRDAFISCDNLQYNVLDGAKYLGNAENPYVALIKAESRSITSCTVPDGTKLIVDYAFQNCEALESVTLPEGLTTIGNYAFSGCRNWLTEIRIPYSVTKMGSSVFNDCLFLDDIYCEAPEQPGGWDASWMGNCAATVHWNGENPAIGSCGENLTFVIDKEGTLTISGNGAMTNWTGNSAFYEHRTTVKKLVLSSGVTTVGNRAFLNFTALESVTLPESLTAIGSNAFENCPLLKQIELPAGLRSIGASAFKACLALREAVLPAGVQSIGTSAFASCTYLPDPFIPASVETMGSAVFSNCNSISNLYCGAKSRPVGWSTAWRDGTDTELFWGCTEAADPSPLGDLNGDGIVSIMDVTFLLMILAGDNQAPANVTAILPEKIVY